MKFRTASNNDLAQIIDILKHVNLPYDDCQYHLDSFMVIEKSEEIIGVGGLELYKETALLRSVAIVDKFQGHSIGDRLCSKLINQATKLGITEIYLLTETAEAYFKNRGFVTIRREEAPEPIKQTRQFSGLCPSSATVMKMQLTE